MIFHSVDQLLQFAFNHATILVGCKDSLNIKNSTKSQSSEDWDISSKVIQAHTIIQFIQTMNEKHQALIFAMNLPKKEIPDNLFLSISKSIDMVSDKRRTEIISDCVRQYCTQSPSNVEIAKKHKSSRRGINTLQHNVGIELSKILETAYPIIFKKFSNLFSENASI